MSQRGALKLLIAANVVMLIGVGLLFSPWPWLGVIFLGGIAGPMLIAIPLTCKIM